MLNVLGSKKIGWAWTGDNIRRAQRISLPDPAQEFRVCTAMELRSMNPACLNQKM
jgi:hypothetical protein